MNRSDMKQFIFIFLAISTISGFTFAQTIPLTLPQLGENVRRTQLLGENDFTASFMLRPLTLNAIDRTTSSDTLEYPLFFNKLLGEKDV